MVTQASYYPGNVSKNTLYASKQYLTEWMKVTYVTTVELCYSIQQFSFIFY